MGLFDTVINYFEIDSRINKKVCQTKDIDDCMGGTMSTYFLSPRGELFLINYDGTQDFCGYDSSVDWGWEPNGKHGRVERFPLTKTIDLYANPKECIYRLTLIDGKLQCYELLEEVMLPKPSDRFLSRLFF